MNTNNTHRISNTGWIKLHRCLLEHPLWLNSTPGQKTVLITLLMLANHTEKKWEWQGKPYTCKPGQLITSLESLRKKCGKGVSIRNIRTCFKRFATHGFLTHQTAHRSTMITICNWDSYQNEHESLDTIPDNESTSKRQRTDTELTTNKNDKECKNERININADINSVFNKPAIEEIEAYAQSQGFSIDSRHFWDYYESRGWMAGKVKMKNWQAAVRTWNRNQTAFGKQTKLSRIGKEVINDGNYTTVTA